MQKRLLTVLAVLAALSVAGFAASNAANAKKMQAGPAPDKAYLEKLLDGWNMLNPATMEQYYALGDNTFFDVAPLKYNNWGEYQKGVTDLLKGYKGFKLSLNDDAQIHQSGDVVWTSATVKEDAVTTAGKHEMATLRWTVIFQKQDGKWLIVHEHTSEAVQ